MKTITVTLTAEETERLRLPATASGGLQGLLRRLQSRMRMRENVAVLTVSDKDLRRIAHYWARNGRGRKPGSGGYQRRLPVRALSEYLPAVAPMFADGTTARQPVSYCYFKREAGVGEAAKIKIGRGTRKRSRAERSTDNPRRLVTLLALVETPGRDEAYFHERFARFRIRADQEWFWADEALMQFIEQELTRADGAGGGGDA